jgi:hypothetical protein
MSSSRMFVSSVALKLCIVVALMLAMASAGVSQLPGPGAPATHVEPASTPKDPLATLNDAFRAAYQKAKEATLARGGPVILVEGDSLVLKKGGQRVEAHYTPAIYHVLKSFAHIPLALDVILATRAGDAPLDDAIVGELRQYRGLIANAEATLGSLGLDPEQVGRQRKIIASCVKFLDRVVDSRACRGEDRVAFARRMTPFVMANAAEAGRAELDAIHRQVGVWKAQMTEEEWKGLSVVILGSALPRNQNLTVQYFARLLGEPGEGRRITFAESIRDEAKALDLMATRIQDTGIGVDFFNDPLRMHRDLLSDAAKDYLPLLIDRP